MFMKYLLFRNIVFGVLVVYLLQGCASTSSYTNNWHEVKAELQKNKHPTEKFQLHAVKMDPKLIEKIDNPFESVQFAAINKKPIILRYISNPTKAAQLLAIKLVSPVNTPYADFLEYHPIKYVKNPSEEMQLLAVKNYGQIIKHLRNPTKKVRLAANDRR